MWVETKIARLEGPVNERTFRTDEEFERCGHAGSGQPGLTADSQRETLIPAHLADVQVETLGHRLTLRLDARVVWIIITPCSYSAPTLPPLSVDTV